MKFNYREVQLDFTPELGVLYMLFERYHSKKWRSLKENIKYFRFRSKIQMGHPVLIYLTLENLSSLGTWKALVH